MPPTPLYLWQIGRRPLLAYAAGDRAGRLRALALYSRTNLKRRLFLRGIQLAVHLGIDGLFARSSERDAGPALPAPQELEMLLDKIRQHGGGTSLDWLITWPAQPERRRWYIVFRDTTNSTAGIVKIGRGSFNQRQLHNEAHNLAELAAIEGVDPPFSFPSVLFESALDNDRTALALNGFPMPALRLSSRFALMHGAKVVRHLAAVPVPATKMPLRQIVWFPLLLEKAPNSAAVRRIQDIAGKLIDVGFAHGDLGPGNMMRTGKDGLFLFDWENASKQAPVLTDEVALWLSLRQRKIMRNPPPLMGALLQTVQKEKQDRLWCALAFLYAHDNLAAGRLLEHWDGVDPYTSIR